MKIDPTAPATGWPSSEFCPTSRGIPIRLELAARVMQGFASNPERTKYTVRGDAEVALEVADELIAAYNATEDK